MQSEQQCKPSARFLISDEYFSDNAIVQLQSDTVKRCETREKNIAYEQYIRWKPQANEIAVFTLYAYADIQIPKKFDIIFSLDNPNQFIKIDFELTQCVYEGWYPMNTIADGHKHLCVLSFDKSVPDILFTLQRGESRFSTYSSGRKFLGLCNSPDFTEIANGIKKNTALKRTYGKEWYKYDKEA